MPSGGNRYGHLGLQMEKINLLDDNMSDLITPLPLEGTFLFCSKEGDTVSATFEPTKKLSRVRKWGNETPSRWK